MNEKNTSIENLLNINRTDTSDGLPDGRTFSPLSVPPLSSSPKSSSFFARNLESHSGLVPLRSSLVNEVKKQKYIFVYFRLILILVAIFLKYNDMSFFHIIDNTPLNSNQKDFEK